MPGSPFYPDPVSIGDPVLPIKTQKEEEEKRLFPAMQQKLNRGPSPQELEDWYQELQELADAALEPSAIRERLLDLRDEIYKHLH